MNQLEEALTRFCGSSAMGNTKFNNVGKDFKLTKETIIGMVFCSDEPDGELELRSIEEIKEAFGL